MPTKEHILLAANTPTKLVEVNANRIVLTIQNLDPGSVLWVSDKPPSSATGALMIPPYEEKTMYKRLGDRTDRDWWGTLYPNGGYVAIGEEMEMPKT